jgi:hypothetical protein
MRIEPDTLRTQKCHRNPQLTPFPSISISAHFNPVG